MAYRYTPRVVYSNAGRASALFGLIQWDNTNSVWLIRNASPHFSIDSTSTATVPRIRVVAPEGTFINAQGTANSDGIVVQRVTADTATVGVTLLEIVLNGPATVANEQVSFSAVWDELAVR